MKLKHFMAPEKVADKRWARPFITKWAAMLDGAAILHTFEHSKYSGKTMFGEQTNVVTIRQP